MILEVILALFAGILAGTITGILPGIHINLIAAMLLAFIASNSIIEVFPAAIFIISLALTHTLLDFIPSIYLGAPEEGTFISVLPGHEMLRDGQGHEAIIYAMTGGIIGAALALCALPLSIWIVPLIENKLTTIIPFILGGIAFYVILREKNILLAIIIFIIAGFIGYSSLNLPLNEPLLPLLTGLFGCAGIVTSLKQKQNPTKQEITFNYEKNSLTKSIIPTLIFGIPFSLLPALGSGYGTYIGSEALQQTRKSFLMLTGAMSTFVMISSGILVYSIDKARTGAAAAISNLIKNPTIQETSIMILTVIITIIIVYFLGIYISKICANKINSINYVKVSYSALLFILFITLIISGPLGVLVLITSTALGIFTIESSIKRTHLMGALVIPTIINYLI